MRYWILISCLVQFQVQASADWLNRTVRVDLIVDRSSYRAFDPKYDKLIQSERIANGVNATNGQYPWTILTTAWSGPPGGLRVGTPCSATIISSNFVLSDFHCVGQDLHPPAAAIEAYYGAVQWSGFRTPTNFVRSYWYIEPSSQDSPNIVLFRMNETITFNPNLHPVRLPFYVNFSYEGWSSFILGYRLPTGPSMPHLQAAAVGIFENSLCNLYGNIADHEMCGIEGSETGSGIRFDGFTGGAWLVNEYSDECFVFMPVIVGIHQYQYVNQTASYGRATRVSHFVEWIQTLTGANSTNQQNVESK